MTGVKGCLDYLSNNLKPSDLNKNQKEFSSLNFFTKEQIVLMSTSIRSLIPINTWKILTRKLSLTFQLKQTLKWPKEQFKSLKILN